jgi:ligand-binding SRPBCC domain-containing protein
VIVNVCPAATSKAPPDKIWSVLTAPEKFEDWQDARYISSDPPGPVEPGQVINLKARGFGREWPVRIDVRDMDPQHRWMDLMVHLPLGLTNHEHLTLTQTKEGGTLVRFN